jgi:hypothetical protein
VTARTDPADYYDRDLHELHAHERAIEPVGYQEIADRLGVKEDTVRKWRTRGNFPEPEPTTVGGRPWWQWGRVEAWAIETEHLCA